MRPLFARLVLLVCVLSAVIGCSDDTTSPANNNPNEASIRDNTGDDQQPPLHGGTISGRVFDDADLDGELDFNERAVSGVVVTLRGAASGGGTSFGSQRITSTDTFGQYSFDGLRAGTYQVFVAASSRSSASAAVDVVLTETDGEVTDATADLGVAAEDHGDDQGGDDGELVVGAFIRVLGDYLPDADVLLASNWVIEDCANAACAFGRLRGPITYIDDRSSTFAVMGTLLRAGEETFPLYAQVGQRADVILHDPNIGDDFIADLVEPWFSQREEIHGRIDRITFVRNSLRLEVLGTVVVIPGAEPF